MMATGKQSFSASQREDLIQEWKQSGKSKKKFCEEKGLKYMTFVTWKAKDQTNQTPAKDSFLQVEVRSETETLFAKVLLNNGTALHIYQPVEASYLSRLLK